MKKLQNQDQYISVPSSRTSRLIRLGGLTASIAADILVSASGSIIRGRRPELQNLMTKEKNILKLVKELSLMRGAALKIGQMLSLESGEILPPEINESLALLRNQAYRMPPRQLKQVLVRSWGEKFLNQFKYFDVNPIAAASIGQVHKCQTINGTTLAIKLQYPGEKESIDSDI